MEQVGVVHEGAGPAFLAKVTKMEGNREYDGVEQREKMVNFGLRGRSEKRVGVGVGQGVSWPPNFVRTEVI